MEDLTGKQFGPYQVVAPLGEGGMAAVYKAYQPAMERHVAIKVLPRHMAGSPEFIARFKREAHLLAQLQHPHILPVFDYGESDGYTYIVMPFLQSGTLADLLKTRRVSLPEIYRIISQIGDALGYAHARGMIHRDVKPSNVLIDERGNCLLTDFGLARMAETGSMLTSSGAIMGTPAYMSPEQGAGNQVDGRSDIYALGVILFEMVTGQVPYSAETPIAIVFKHIQDPLPSARKFVPDLSESLELILMKTLEKKADDRYQTADDFVKAIQAEASTSSRAYAAPTPTPPLAPIASSIQPINYENQPQPTIIPDSQFIPQATWVDPQPASLPAQRPISRPPTSLAPVARSGFTIWALAGAGIIIAGIIGLIVLFVGFNYYQNNIAAAPPTPTQPVEATSTQSNDAALILENTSTTEPIPPTLTPTLLPTDIPTLPAPPTLAIPAGVPFVRINNISLSDQNQYVVEYETFEYTETLPGVHVHFFFNTVSVEQAGMPGSGPWKLYGGPRPFTGYRSADRPQNASQLCALVANANHSIQVGSGHCFPLPDVPTATARTQTACLNAPAADAQTATSFEAGETVLLFGISADQSWISIQNPETKNSSSCWVPVDSSVTAGDTSNLPTLNP
ncbi:MAG: serine/threonine protein kinase [Anaerolineae bacterium]|nr:serine/threonine protein kinase [Anaerolineae bacterium]